MEGGALGLPLKVALLLAGLGLTLALTTPTRMVLGLDTIVLFFVGYSLLLVFFVVAQYYLSGGEGFEAGRALQISLGALIIYFAAMAAWLWPNSSCIATVEGVNPASIPTPFRTGEDEMLCRFYLGLGEPYIYVALVAEVALIAFLVRSSMTRVVGVLAFIGVGSFLYFYLSGSPVTLLSVAVLDTYFISVILLVLLGMLILPEDSVGAVARDLFAPG